MGQYYTTILRDEKEGKYYNFSPRHYQNGVKLMEHSYLGNNFVKTVCSELFNKIRRVAWVGDYAEKGDVQNPLASYFIKEEREVYEKDDYYESKIPFAKYRYIFNHSKQEYIDLKHYREKSNEEFTAHPLPLLTAIGNGKGGGDYEGTNMKYIGRWACDFIETSNDSETAKKYKELNIYFKEER